MSTLVVQECHLCLCLANMRDADKVRFLNAPMSQTGFFVMHSRTLPSSSWLHRSRPRRSNTSRPDSQLLPPPIRWPQHLSLLIVKGGPLPPPSLPCCSSLPPVSGRAGGPETGDLEMEGAVLWEMVNTPLPPLEEDRVENVLFCPAGCPKSQQKSSFLYLWVPRGHGELWMGRTRYQRPYSRTLCPAVEQGKLHRTLKPHFAQETPEPWPIPKGVLEACTGHWKGQHPWCFGGDSQFHQYRRDVESERLKGNEGYIRN